MIYPHVIRLRHPWSDEPAANGGTVRRRKFNRPTGISQREQVWLVIGIAGPLGSVAVNGVSLNCGPQDESACPSEGESDGRRAWDVTSHLADHNEIAIEADSNTAVAVEEGVSIEIRLAPVTDF